MKETSLFKDKTHYGIDNVVSKKWSSSRNSIKDLYKSEKYFFLRKLKESNSFLDLGCAAGGFYKIIKRYKKSFSYFGFDVSPSLIKIAKKKYKNGNFYKYNGKKIKILKKVDMAYSFGTLHHVKNYFSLIRQMLSLSKKYVLFDIRLTKKKTLIDKRKSYQKIVINKKILSKINYNIINNNDFIKTLNKITGKYKVSFYKYNHKVNKSVIKKYKKVDMTAVLIDKTVEIKS